MALLSMVHSFLRLTLPELFLVSGRTQPHLLTGHRRMV